jgi:hypothetical protein
MFIHDYYANEKRIFDGIAFYEDFEKGVQQFNLKISDYTETFKDYLWMCIRKLK